MLDGLLGRGFASKCKSLIKMTKSRIEVIRRKRNATSKFLKKDMADLLANGLDINAYGRAEGLLAELTLSSCYDFVEKSCDFVLKHLSVMQKMRHCPEDCREAVSSLMFAAARFSDLPELRDLRETFCERYENSLELFVNQEFIEKLSSKPPTREKKVQLMCDIASEFCINWDSRAFEQRASKPSAPVQEPPKTYGTPCVDDKYKSMNGKDTEQRVKHDVSHKGRTGYDIKEYRMHDEKGSSGSKRNELSPRFEVHGNGYKVVDIVREEPKLNRATHENSYQGRQEVVIDKYEPWKEDTPLKTVRSGSSSQRKKIENFDAGPNLRDGIENAVPKRDRHDVSSHGMPDKFPSYAGPCSKGDGRDSVTDNGSVRNVVNSAQDVQHEANKGKPFYNNAIPPPYTKPNGKPKGGKYGCSSGSSFTGFDGKEVPKDPSTDMKVSAADRSEKIIQESYYPDHEREGVGSIRAHRNGHDNVKDRDDGITNTIPKPRSSRRRHSKAHANPDDPGDLEGVGFVKRRSRSRRRDDSRRGLQVLFDDEHHQNDEEERIIDKLLMHYSKKTSPYKTGKVRRKSKSRHSQHRDFDDKPSQHQHVTPDEDEDEETLQPPRSISLPREQTGSSGAAAKVFARAASFQPDRSTPAKHVHPKLPNYDDLAAQFAALKGR